MYIYFSLMYIVDLEREGGKERRRRGREMFSGTRNLEISVQEKLALGNLLVKESSC